MRKLNGMFLVAAMTLCPVAGRAADDVMAGYYSNTVVVTVPNMGTFKTEYAPDHSYKSTGPFGASVGTWAYADGKVCRTQTEPTPPPGFPNPICDSAEAHQPGDSWQIEAMGQKFDAKMLAGDQLNAP